ncbi:MAG: hypothetical protein NDJ24_08325 [Alphaproteobacteria bacterium]|nr:hypothetical protein [Alphaproteobacteria bacterium]
MVRPFMLAGALGLYAVLGTPTPDRLGIIELLVGGGLLVAAGRSAIWQVIGTGRLCPGQPFFTLNARLLLFWGLTVPVLVALVAGHDTGLILRDLVAFLFLLLPLFLWPCLDDWPNAERLFPWLLCAVGVVYAVRVVGAVTLNHGALSWPTGYITDPANLLNAPTALWALLYLTGMGGWLLIRASTVRSFQLAAVCFLLVFLLLAGMGAIGQRAHIGAWGLAVLLWSGALLWRRPWALGRLLWLGLPLLLVLGLSVSELMAGLLEKQALVGMNNRLEEARVVVESFHDRPWALLLGQGWGASIVSPAVGPYPVNYTHSLFTTYLLKTGLIGLMLVGGYLLVLAAGIWRILWVFPVGGVALAAPFLIDISLYASFKTLDFGLLLALIVLWTKSCQHPRQSCQNTLGWCMQDKYPE